MNQMDLFSHGLAEPLAAPHPPERTEGERRAEVGINRAVAKHADRVGIAREMAFDIARGKLPHADGETRRDWLCNADDVAAAIKAAGMPPLENEAGGVFRDGNWEVVDIIKAKRAASNSNLLRQWRRKVDARTEG